MMKARKIGAATVALFLAFASTGCGIVNQVQESCPTGARFAGVWSSEQSSSLLTFYDETGPIGKKRIDVKGFVPGHDFVRAGDEWIGVSNGSKWDSSVHIVRINPTTCQVIPGHEPRTSVRSALSLDRRQTPVCHDRRGPGAGHYGHRRRATDRDFNDR